MSGFGEDSAKRMGKAIFERVVVVDEGGDVFKWAEEERRERKLEVVVWMKVWIGWCC